MSEYAFLSGARRQRRTGFLLAVMALICVAALAAVLGPASRSFGSAETRFVAENRAAMRQMMVGMDAPPSGDADRDFATIMIAHHQGAIAMAGAELRHGRNEQLRRLAQGIIVEQQQEIAIMRVTLGDAALSLSGAICSSVSAPSSRPALPAWASRGDAADDTP